MRALLDTTGVTREKMYKIIGILFISYFVAIEGRTEFPTPSLSNIKRDDAAAEAVEKISYRLPDTVVPINYNLEITPYFYKAEGIEEFTFKGAATIQLEVINEVESITLHARNITLPKTVTLKKDDAQAAEEGVSYKQDLERDFVIITVKDKKIAKGKYTLTIKDYTGILADDMRGFYRSSYLNDKNETVWLATTHFEPVGARRAFPCFDEPKFKATFDLKIQHDPETFKGKKYRAISNKKASLRNDIYTKFEQTPKMSTYLLAFIVSDFEGLENEAKNFTVWARPNAYKKGQLALDEGEKLLKALEEVTGVVFDMGKMDQAAIPDFSAGAMENWGLVTYRESSLLYDESVSTTSQKQNIIETIAHEFAHQWFGDLVSPKWWKYIWLNEGFANFFQSYITDKVDSKWQSVNQAVVKSIQTTAFDADSSSTTHPINVEVETPAEISAVFDSISYQKGGAVIRMMQHFLTDEIFREGLNTYLMDHKNSTADSNDLFKSIQKVVDKPGNTNKINVTEVMDNWVNRKGYPVVNVTRLENGNIEVKQERFVTYNASGDKDNQTLWHIPINFVVLDLNKPDDVPKNLSSFDVTTATHWLTDQSMTIETELKGHQVLVLNKQQTGFYRVDYDETSWNYIMQTLNSDNRTDIHELNRAQFVNDALAFVKQGSMNLTNLLFLSEYLTNETSYIAWYPGFKAFTWLKSKLYNSEHYQFFHDKALNITKKLVEHVGFEDKPEDDYVQKLNRIAALKFACTLDHGQCHSNMTKKVEEWLKAETKDKLSPDLKQITLCNGLRKADLELWEKVFKKTVESTGTAKSELIEALGCSENTTIVIHYLTETILNENDKLNNSAAVLNSIIDNSVAGVDAILDLMANHFVTVFKKLNYVESKMTSLFDNLAAKITTQERLEKLVDLNTKNVEVKFTKRAVDTAKKNIEWVEENEGSIRAWKDTNGVGTMSASITLISSILVLVYITFK